MKKYSKLGLVLIALFFFAFFLFYKLRYDRLYGVIQVLEVFGTPPKPDRCDGDSLAAQPAPTWRQILTGVHVYSASCWPVPGEDGPCPQVQVLAAIQPEAKATTAGLTCKLWYEGSVNPIVGTYSVQEAGEDAVTTLSCEAKYTNKVPYGVSFHMAKESSGDIIQVSAVMAGKTTKSSVQLCILPATVQDQDRGIYLKQSVALHALAGLAHIVVYAAAIPHSLLHAIHNIHSETNAQVRLRLWNPPSHLNKVQTDAFVSRDCYLQSHATALNYLLLQDNQVLLPVTSTNLTEALSLSRLVSGPNNVSVRRFCSEYPTDKSSENSKLALPLLQSTTYNKELSSQLKPVSIYHSSPSQNNPQTKGIDLDEVVKINQYGDCDRYDISPTDDTAVHDQSALRFADGINKILKDL